MEVGMKNISVKAAATDGAVYVDFNQEDARDVCDTQCSGHNNKTIIGGDDKEMTKTGLMADDKPEENDVNEDGNNDDEETGDTADDDNDDHLLKDRGWAWLVTFGCFLSHFITGGLERSDGVFFLKLTARYGESAQVAWAGALSATVMLSMGPVASALSSRFSTRTSVMVGAFIYSLGLVCSGLAPDMPTLLICFGLVQGFGRGLTYAPGLIIVGMYFNRHRGLGVGLATAGVGAGTFVLPPLVDFLFEEFGLSGAFLVLGGLSLNFCVVAMLYRPLFVHRRIVLGARGRRGSVTADELLGKGAREGTEQRGVFLDEDNDDGDVADEGTLLNNARDKIKQHDEGSSQRLHRQDLDEDDAASGQKNSPHTVPLSANEIHARTSARARVHLITGTSSPANHTHHNGENAASPSPVTRKRKKIFASKQILSGLKTCFPVDRPDGGSQTKRKMLDLSLLRHPAFLFYCFSICLFTASMKSSLVFLPPLVRSKGVSEIEAAYLLSISGVVDTIGRITIGVGLELKQTRHFWPWVFNGLIFAICALSFVAPFLSSFAQFGVVFALFGFCTGAYVSQKSVVLMDMLGDERLGSSFGLLVFFQGLGNLIGPPMSGVLKDVLGQYREVFFLGGGSLAVAGGLMVVSNIYSARAARPSLSAK